MLTSAPAARSFSTASRFSTITHSWRGVRWNLTSQLLQIQTLYLMIQFKVAPTTLNQVLKLTCYCNHFIFNSRPWPVDTLPVGAVQRSSCLHKLLYNGRCVRGSPEHGKLRILKTKELSSQILFLKHQLTIVTVQWNLRSDLVHAMWRAV